LVSIGSLLWPLIRTTPFERIRPRLLHTKIFRLEGKIKQSEIEFSTIVCARKEIAEYFTELVYEASPKIEFLGNRTLSEIPLIGAKFAVDLVLLETNWFLSRFLMDNGFLILPQMNFVMDITDSMEAIRRRLPRSRVRRIKRVERAGFSWEVTKDPEKVKSFYYEMYLPHMLKRHGNSAQPVSFIECQNLVLKGVLLLIKQEREYVAGAVLVPHGNELYQPIIAVKNVDNVTVGSHAATLYTIVFGKQEGYARVDFGHAPPFIYDGLFRYKKEWGMRIRPARESSAQVFGIKFSNMSDRVRTFLEMNPLVFLEGENLKGLVSINSEHKQVLGSSEVPGLSSLLVVSSELESSNFVPPQLRMKRLQDSFLQASYPVRNLINMCREKDLVVNELPLGY
jgi:hypothetical protein